VYLLRKKKRSFPLWIKRGDIGAGRRKCKSTHRVDGLYIIVDHSILIYSIVTLLMNDIELSCDTVCLKRDGDFGALKGHTTQEKYIMVDTLQDAAAILHLKTKPYTYMHAHQQSNPA
jgi:hypothetical protein